MSTPPYDTTKPQPLTEKSNLPVEVIGLISIRGNARDPQLKLGDLEVNLHHLFVTVDKQGYYTLGATTGNKSPVPILINLNRIALTRLAMAWLAYQYGLSDVAIDSWTIDRTIERIEPYLKKTPIDRLLGMGVHVIQFEVIKTAPLAREAMLWSDIKTQGITLCKISPSYFIGYDKTGNRVDLDTRDDQMTIKELLEARFGPGFYDHVNLMEGTWRMELDTKVLRTVGNLADVK